MDEGVAAVRLRFPTRVQAINELASRDVIFCEICQDFAEAQTELARWEAASSDPVRDDRVAEYRNCWRPLAERLKMLSPEPPLSLFIAHLVRARCNSAGWAVNFEGTRSWLPRYHTSL